MTVCLRVCFAAALLLLSCLNVSPVLAQTNADPDRTFVSVRGKNVGACTRVAPCRSFAYAIDQTPAGGEIVALNPAGYGAVTITKSISIIGQDSGLAQIRALGATAVAINAPGAAVALRGLTISGAAVAINVDQVGSLVISDVTTTSLGGGLNNNAGAAITLTDVSIRGVKSAAALSTSAGVMTLTRVSVGGNGGVGVQASGGKLVLNDSIVSENGSYGLQQLGGDVFVKRSVISNNASNGVLVSDGTFRFDRTAITGNSSTTANGGGGVLASGGAAFSYGNNTVARNAGGDLKTVTQIAPN